MRVRRKGVEGSSATASRVSSAKGSVVSSVPSFAATNRTINDSSKDSR
jgi:hypothetical protein